MDEQSQIEFLDNHLQFVSRVDDWQAALRLVAQPLLEENIIEARYVEAMIQTVLELGDYIVLVPKVAMPHARPESGALGTGVSIVKLDSPVVFGNGKEVFLIICLATNDNQSHLQLLQKVSALIDEEEKVEALLLTKNKQAFLELAAAFIQEEEDER